MVPRVQNRAVGLDYFGARYFSAAQGRFTSPDPKVFSGSTISNPQKWNRYAYVLNNPLGLIDPDGREERKPIRIYLNLDARDRNTVDGRLGSGPDVCAAECCWEAGGRFGRCEFRGVQRQGSREFIPGIVCNAGSRPRDQSDHQRRQVHIRRLQSARRWATERQRSVLCQSRFHRHGSRQVDCHRCCMFAHVQLEGRLAKGPIFSRDQQQPRG